jgi:hypothetical protein
VAAGSATTFCASRTVFGFNSANAWASAGVVKAAVVALSWFEKENEQIRRSKISASRKGEMPEKFPASRESRDQAAELTGVNAHYVSDAKAILEAAPEAL